MNDGNFRQEQHHAGSDEDDYAENESHREDPIDASKSNPMACTFPVIIRGSTPMIGSHHGTHLSPGITPYFLSTFETSEFSNKRWPGNTGIRRKSLSRYNIIAEATKASGGVMASQMRDMAESSCKLERNKIEVVYRTDGIPQVAQLSSVLSKGLFVSIDGDIVGIPQVATLDVKKTSPLTFIYKQAQP